jgi:Uncharacterised nucleotidyltransferase
VLRDDQIGLLRWVLAACSEPPADLPPLPSLDLARLRVAGLATGLTAAVGSLADRHGVELPGQWQPFVADQTRVVAARRQRYAALVPEVLRVLDAAGVGAVPVKGAVLADGVWPVPDARPMSDIDLVVRPAERERAGAALAAGGYVPERRTAAEDIFLAWGDGAAVDVDRESIAHSGKIELHPGWVERVHDYAVDDGGWLLSVARPGELAGAPCRLLPPHALALQALGHLSVGAIRAEVRAVNVVDVSLALAGLDPAEAGAFAGACDALDARLTAPGLWLVAATQTSWWTSAVELVALTARAGARLPSAAAEQLSATSPEQVLRELGARTSVRWRLAFATTWHERACVLRQAATPHAEDLRADAPGRSVLGLHGARARRAVGRARRRMA